MDHDNTPAPGPLTGVDEALLGAAKVWEDRLSPGFWDRFPVARRASLLWGWEGDQTRAAGPERARLAREHAAQARPDLARVHVSWWVRALRAEPDAVRRAVVANLPAGLAEPLRDGLGLTGDDLRPDHPPLPDALRCALALWTVWLVGDLPERPDDPPVIAALTRLDASAVVRLIQATGLAKWSLTPRPLPNPDPKVVERLAHFRRVLTDPDPRFVQVATRDVATIGPGHKLPAGRAGMIGFARLLAAADPYRVRWALQHVPYTTAKTLRTLMGPPGRRSPMLVRWEAEMLRVAWGRLHEEGWLSAPWGATP